MILEKKEQERVTNKKAVVTGGSSGIGNAIAKQLVELGVKTIVADIDEPPSGSDFIFKKTDLHQQDDVDGLFHFLNDQQLTPDILICNAGRGITEKLVEGDPRKWQEVIDLNLMGNLRMVRAFVPGMLEKESGDIIFISSVSAKSAYEWGGIYAASKAGLQMVAETLRLETQPKLRVSSILPGVVDTNFFKNTVGGGHTSVEDIGWGALHPEDVADAVKYIITRPKEVAINELVIRPVAQPF